MTLYRNYKDLGNGTCVQLPTGTDSNGNEYSLPITSKGLFRSAAKEAKGHKVAKSNSIMNTSSNQQFAGTIKGAETQQGRPAVYRDEKPEVGLGANMEITVSLDNGTAGLVEHVLFDGHNLITKKKGYGALPGGVVVGGTYDTDTITLLKAMTPANPFRFHGLHVVNTQGATGATPGAASTTFFTGDNLYYVKAKPDFTNLSEELISFRQALQATQFNPYIQDKPEQRLTFDGFCGLVFKLAAAQRIDLTMTLYSYQGVYSMVKG